MDRGNSTHSARQDDALADELRGAIGPHGSNREEWADPEPPADDDPQPRTQPEEREPGGRETADREASSQDEAEMRRLQHDMEVANDWAPGREA